MEDQLKKDLRAAFKAGGLRVYAADPQTGEVGLHPVSDVMRHEVPHKRCVRVTMVGGASVGVTEDHSLFKHNGAGHNPAMTPLQGGLATPGTELVCINTSKAGHPALESVRVEAIEEIPTPEYMYDLCVPGPENFMLTNGILAHNSYSIGGISLDLEKSSKYEGIKDNAEGQMDKAAEAKTRTVKVMRGLRQGRYGKGMGSGGLGPNVGRGIQSPRNYL